MSASVPTVKKAAKVPPMLRNPQAVSRLQVLDECGGPHGPSLSVF